MISVIVPVYNVERYVSECIESIQNQNYRNMQIILVDDGSTDQSGIICDKYALQDSRIEVIHQKNKGLVAARKSGFERARGDYIGFVDGDDYIAPEMYQMLLRELETSKGDFIHSGYWEDDKKKISFSKEIINLLYDRKVFFENVILKKKNYIEPSVCTKLFKADVIKKSYAQVRNECSLGEDLISLCECIWACGKISITDKVYYHYRIREGSLSQKKDISDLKGVYKLYSNICNVLYLHGVYDDFENIMNEFLWNKLMDYMARINQNDFQMAKYYFKDTNILWNKKIVIYGAGMVGRDYYAQICRYSDCKVIAWIDKHPEYYQYTHVPLCGAEVLDTIDFDILIIAVKEKKMADEIKNELIKEGTNEKKIYWSTPERYSF